MIESAAWSEASLGPGFTPRHSDPGRGRPVCELQSLSSGRGVVGFNQHRSRCWVCNQLGPRSVPSGIIAYVWHQLLKAAVPPRVSSSVTHPIMAGTPECTC